MSVPVERLPAGAPLPDWVARLDRTAFGAAWKAPAPHEALWLVPGLAFARWALDLGPDDYNLPAYFGDKQRRATIRAGVIGPSVDEFYFLSRTTLAEQVWDMNFDSDTNVVEVAVRRLRTKLDQPFDRPLLHTVRGMGYVLEAPEEP